MSVPRWLLEDALQGLRESRDMAGDCDHEVGICMCDLKRTIYQLEKVLG